MRHSVKTRKVGRTRWRRFGVVSGLGLSFIGLLGWMAASGLMPFQLVFSGIPFYLTADSLQGERFVQYAYPDKIANKDTAPLVERGAGKLIYPGSDRTIDNVQGEFVSDTITQIGTARIDGLNQTVCAPLPAPLDFLGWMSVHTVATGPTEATNMTIQSPALRADKAEFSHIMIGTPVYDALKRKGFLDDKDPFADPYNVAVEGNPLRSSFAQEADSVRLTGIRQLGIGTEASWFRINGLKLWANFGNDCPWP